MAEKRLVIEAYDTADYHGAPFDKFEAYVNPSEITIAYEYEYDEAAAPGTTNRRMDFKKAKPGDMSLTLFLDGTGANGRPLLPLHKDNTPSTVQEQVERFHTVTGYSGKLHRTHYLKIGWGSLTVNRCVLKSASIAYKLFTPDGIPLRAVITASFSGNSDDETRVAKEEKKSADLTHVRLVKAGDNLPALCTEVYGDPGMYLRVARANGLDDFRYLVPGTRLRFPPLEK